MNTPGETVWRFRLHEEANGDADLLNRAIEKEIELIEGDPPFRDVSDQSERLESDFFLHISPTRQRFKYFVERCANQICEDNFRIARCRPKIQLPGDAVPFHGHDCSRRRDPSRGDIIPLSFSYHIRGGSPVLFHPYGLPTVRLSVEAGDLLFFRPDYQHAVGLVSEVQKLVNGDMEIV